MKTVLYLCILGIGWCLWSCEPIQSHSEIPEIHFKKLAFDSVKTDLDAKPELKPILTFSFIDGDGDIGADTLRKDGEVSKIHYTWYKKLPDQTYEPFQFPDGTVTATANIPYNSVMNKDEAQNKVLKGTIQLVLSAPLKPQGIDTMRIEYYIYDRAKHQSNIDYTPDFSILNTSVIIE